MARKQFAALPFRIKGNELSVLLITTRQKRRWSVPKGSPIRDAKPYRTAEIEAYEEAGVVGRISLQPLGQYIHRKKKAGRARAYAIQVFAMKVLAQKRGWPEKGQRETAWLPASKAIELVHRAELGDLIKRLQRDHALIAGARDP